MPDWKAEIVRRLRIRHWHPAAPRSRKLLSQRNDQVHRRTVPQERLRENADDRPGVAVHCEPATLRQSIETAVREVDPSVPIVRLRDMNSVFDESIRRPRLLA